MKNGFPSLAADTSTSKPKKSAKRSTQRKLDTLPVDQANQTLLNQIIDFYHEALLQRPEALAYLQKRGLGNPELIKHFKLGFANRTLAYRLPDKQYKAGKQLRGQLQEIGILRSSGQDQSSLTLLILCEE